MEAGKRTINDIFNGNRVLEIPFFQRSYVWDEDQWDRLLKDMEAITESNKPYFLGSVILKQQNTNSQNNIGDVRTVVDGQQRLTTLNIFFKVLCLKINKNAQFERVFRVINDNGLALRHNHNDIASFNRILELEAEEELHFDDNITRAYNYFSEKIDVARVDFQTVISNVMFVGIDLAANENEQQIFDTINSLGVRLTTAELLKNYLFGRNDIDAYNKYWLATFEKDEDIKEFWDREITAGRIKRENIDLFFFSFLLIKIQDPKLKISAEDRKSFSKLEDLFESYKKITASYGVSKTELIKEIKEYADIYSKNINYDVLDREVESEYGMERINTIIFGLENTTLIPFVLYILKNVEIESERTQIFEYLESYIMRRMVCHTTNKNYNRLFSEQLISNEILTKQKLKELLENKSDKVNYMPTDKELLEGFQTSKLVNKQTAGILYLIESKIRNRRSQSTSLLGLDYYSLEHIMPKKWENHWQPITDEAKKIERNRKLLTIGNLTIITSSLNSSIRDATWLVKREGVGEKKGLRHYSSGIETFAEYVDRDEWNESVIDERATYLFNKAKDVWKS